MAILIYRHDFSDTEFLNKVASNALSPDATINSAGGFFSQLVAFDITSTNAEDTDGTNLSEFMQSRGFTLVTATGAKILELRHDWGRFEVADAPSIGILDGDTGYCTDGDAGSPTNAYFDGTDWVVFGGANHGTIIATS